MTDDDTTDSDQSMLRRAHDEFTRTLTALTEAELQSPSPCQPWTVAEVIDHVAGGAVMAAALLAGNGAADALAIRAAWTRDRLTRPHLHVDLALESAAFNVADPAERVDHPVVPMSAADMLGQRIMEYVVHTWDIRRAIGDPTPTQSALARRAWQFAAPVAPFAAELKVFGPGPSGLLPADADDEARLLDLTGRRVSADLADSAGTVVP